MPKKTGIVFVILGAVLILSALLLFLRNDAESDRAGEEAREALEELQTHLQQVPTENPKTMEAEQTQPTEDPETEMTVVEIDGYGYIGYLTIPELELELPVMDRCDYKRLEKSPCRQFGSTVTDDIVIAAHNYAKHFGNLYHLSEGDRIRFTDMKGRHIDYTIVKIQLLEPTDVNEVQYSSNHMVLYTCTYGGENRVAVFCDRMETEE